MIRGALALKTLVLLAAVAITPAPSIAQELSVTGASAASAHGLVGGVQGGYNWQRGPAVFGFEADFSAADLSTSMTGSLSCLGLPCRVFVPPPAAATSSSIDWYGTVRGRLGWAAGPVLLYGTGGLAYGKVDLSSSFGTSGLSVTAQTSSVKTGWVAGGGVELMLQPNVMLNLGYQYVDLGTVSVASPAPPTTCCIGYLTQTAGINARFQTVTVGVSWKFGAVDAASRPWEGGYFGGHAGGAWGADTFANYSGFNLSCFTGETQVLMADGTSRPIAQVKIGDEVLGEGGAVNRVVAIETPVLGRRKLYAFNGGPAFVTREHPFMTRGGWKSVSPEATFAEHRLSVGALKIGDELVALDTVTTRPKALSVALGGASQVPSEVVIETRFAPLQSAMPHDGDAFMTVYNLKLDGNNTYFANNYLVHNKS